MLAPAGDDQSHLAAELRAGTAIVCVDREAGNLPVDSVLATNAVGAAEGVRQLAAAGHRSARRPEGPAGLTERELDVLALLARGLSSKEIAARLTITPKTARNHTEHIYAKIGTTNRAGASLFAVRHGLLTID